MSENGPHRHILWMCRHYGLPLFERISRIWEHGIVGGKVPLGVGFQVSEVHAKPRVSLLAYSSATALVPHLPPTTLPAMMIRD